MAESAKHDWTVEQAREIHELPLLDLVYRAQGIHRRYHDPGQVQLCSLLSIKTGACPEDCAYCPQSGRYRAKVEIDRLLAVNYVLDRARAARDAGATRFCMGAAWREVSDGEDFDAVLDMVRGVRALDMEACMTLGMLTDSQAERLADAGLTAYNHNLDTSREYYDSIITTRTYDDRLATIARVRKAGINLCCGGIIGMGESLDDRCAMLVELANLSEVPESVPINALVAVEGTPLAERQPVHPFETVRMVATARLMMPPSVVRLSAGRSGLSEEAQALCFLAGANSIFYGDRLLTTGNPDTDSDLQLLRRLGVTPQPLPSVRGSNAA